MILYRLALAIAHGILICLKYLCRWSHNSRERELQERLGHINPVFPPAAGSSTLWIHAASVGESLLALKVIHQLKSSHMADSIQFLITVQTLAAYHMVRQQAPTRCLHFAPLDSKRAVERALKHINPSALWLIEAELWPTLLGFAHQRNIPILVLNARMSERSSRRFGWVRSFLTPLLAPVHILARSEQDAQRYQRLGVLTDHCRVVGDLKRLPEPPSSHPLVEPGLFAWLTRGPLLIAASTHPSEETLILDALTPLLEQFPTVQLLLAPRHPTQRTADPLLRTLPRRSDVTLSKHSFCNVRVLFLDTLGELRTLFPQATLALMGGTWVPVGGHNLWEPLSAGCPVIYGPHTRNVETQRRAIEEAGVGWEAADGERLRALVHELLQNPAQQAALQQRARAFAAQQSADRSVFMDGLQAWCQRFLPGAMPSH